MPSPLAKPLDRRTCLGGVAGLLTIPSFSSACAAVPARANPVIETPKVNQLGFAPSAMKRFCIVDSPAISARPVFTIESANGTQAFAGSLGPATDVTRSAGEHVRAGEFTGLTRPGRYRIRVGDLTSAWFRIGGDIYKPLLRDAARAFYIIRANDALDDPVTGIRHAASHQVEAAMLVDGVKRDLRGGWYNAGDYGKWTHMAGISASLMMWLHELRPAGADALSLAVPQTYPGLPDLLQQARWGLDWLLRMQNLDGGVLHKVDSEPEFAWGLAPEKDDLPGPRARAGQRRYGSFRRRYAAGRARLRAARS